MSVMIITSPTVTGYDEKHYRFEMYSMPARGSTKLHVELNEREAGFCLHANQSCFMES
jgi:hypothetical protein